MFLVRAASLRIRLREGSSPHRIAPEAGPDGQSFVAVGPVPSVATDNVKSTRRKGG
ncbi:hypothetical protein FTUN_6060 [Frigoriglobus tundricola]|uniref:Uncharacterized protein n=1 Tax=Frigoriglobus tundricola TaxID=2774151 RepID=A0A6M5YYB0_9BACT|nr:hypothetical protein FTUN_6060 [Frigoriglobus tundricola]